MSRLTDFLKLFKYDPTQDGENTYFNIDTALNENWDKIDTQMKASADNITTLQNKKNIIIKTILIEAKSGWTQQSAGYFSYRISDSDITQTDVVDINFSPLDVILGKTEGIFPSTDSHNGAVYLYSKQLPKERLSTTMIIQKGV